MRALQYKMGQEKTLYQWNPYIFAGTPFLADMQTALFYPPNWIYFFIPPERGIVYYIVLHYLFAALFTFLYLRSLQIEPVSAMAGAIIYAFSGFMILHTIHLNMIAAYSLFPLILLLLENLIRRSDAASAGFFALSIGILILAGMPQFTLFIFIIISIYFLGHINIKDLFSTSQLKLTGLFISACIIGILLSAVQLLPSLEFFSHTLRSESVELADAGRGSLSLKDLILIIIPDYYGHPLYEAFRGDYFFWEKCFYVGIIPIILMLLGLFNFPAREKGRAWSFIFLSVLGILLSIGNALPLYELFYNYFPFFKSFRAPVRFLVFPLLGIVYFSAVFLDQLPQFCRIKSISKEKQKIPSLIMVLSALFMIALTVFLIQDKSLTSREGFVYFVITGFSGLGVLSAGMWGAVKQKHLRLGVIILLAVSAFFLRGMANPTVPSNYYEERTAAFVSMGGKTPPQRIHYYPPIQLKDTLNLPSTKGVSNVSGYNPVALKHYLEYLIYADYEVLINNKIARQLTANGNVFGLHNPEAKMFAMLNLSTNVTYQETPHGIAFQFKPVQNSLPRAFIVPRYEGIETGKELLKKLRSPQFDFTKTVLFSSPPDESSPYYKHQPPADHITSEKNPIFTHYSPGKIILQVSPQQNCWLVLSEVYYPGWQILIDNKPREIYRANHAFMAAPLTKEDKEVKLIFKSSSLKMGSLIFGGALSLLVLIWLLPLALKKDR